MEYDEAGRIVLVKKDSHVWSGFNHNWLRTTRILECLNVLGMEKEAVLLLECLEEIYKSKICENMDHSMIFWRDAVDNIPPRLA
jgi:hypothetical protein